MKNSIASNFKIKRKTTEKNRVAGHFEIEKEIEGVNGTYFRSVFFIKKYSKIFNKKRK